VISLSSYRFSLQKASFASSLLKNKKFRLSPEFF